MPITRDSFEHLIDEAEERSRGKTRTPTMFIDVRHYQSRATGEPVIGLAVVIEDEAIGQEARAFLQTLEAEQALDLAHRLVRAVRCSESVQRVATRRKIH